MISYLFEARAELTRTETEAHEAQNYFMHNFAFLWDKNDWLYIKSKCFWVEKLILALWPFWLDSWITSFFSFNLTVLFSKIQPEKLPPVATVQCWDRNQDGRWPIHVAFLTGAFFTVGQSQLDKVHNIKTFLFGNQLGPAGSHHVLVLKRDPTRQCPSHQLATYLHETAEHHRWWLQGGFCPGDFNLRSIPQKWTKREELFLAKRPEKTTRKRGCPSRSNWAFEAVNICCYPLLEPQRNMRQIGYISGARVLWLHSW